jgi:electron transfer flavoprotein beta subunit
MNILICISQVPDTTTKIQFDASGKELNKAGVKFVVNPYDEFALSRALEIQESQQGVKITLISVGGQDVTPTIVNALAVGGEEAVRIDLNPQDGYEVAYQIAQYAKDKNFDLIMLGKESIDNNGSEVPGMVAEMLDMPFVSFATQLDLNGKTATIRREVDGGTEVLEAELPLVLSAQKGLAEWRIANMRGIMAAKKKPIHVVAPAGSHAKTSIQTYQLPPQKAGCQMIQPDDVNQLVDILAQKGVI